MRTKYCRNIHTFNWIYFGTSNFRFEPEYTEEVSFGIRADFDRLVICFEELVHGRFFVYIIQVAERHCKIQLLSFSELFVLLLYVGNLKFSVSRSEVIFQEDL